MDLLAIIQDRINANLTTTGVFADHSTDHEPANMHDVFNIEATDTFFENTSRTTGHDAYGAFSETVLAVVHKAPLPTVKNKHVMPESNQSPNDWLGMAEDAVKIPVFFSIVDTLYLPFRSFTTYGIIMHLFNIKDVFV